MKRILVIGSLNMDMVIGMDHLPVLGETILAENYYMNPGGKGANQAYAAGKLGADTTFFGAVGDDSNGQRLLHNLNEVGVNTDHIVVKENSSTGTAVITVDKNGDNCIIVIPGANALLSKEDIIRNKHLIEACDILLLQLEIPLETVLFAAHTARQLNKTVILDPAPAPVRPPVELLPFIDIIKPNETELHMLTGKMDISSSIDTLRGYGAKDVIVTLGENGVYVNSVKEGTFHLPALPVVPIDTTAAGDSFTAALAVMLADGKTLKEAAAFANKVGAVAVTREGAQQSIPTLKEVAGYSIAT